MKVSEKSFQVIFLGYLVIAASSDDLVEEDEKEAKQEEFQDTREGINFNVNNY